MADDKPIALRSPFNGGTFRVPPETSPALIDELVKRGFERLDDEDKPKKSKRKDDAA